MSLESKLLFQLVEIMLEENMFRYCRGNCATSRKRIAIPMLLKMWFAWVFLNYFFFFFKVDIDGFIVLAP